MKLLTNIYIDTAPFTDEEPVYERLELFDFESIEVTSSIQEVRDIGSIFTDFSQQFTIPASKTNNRILRHFYNLYLTNGYDARVKRLAFINLNGITFRDGYIRLSEANIRNGKPFSYSLTFFGAIVNLKDILGDSELKSLLSLSQYNHEYGIDNVYDGFKTGLFSNDIVYPSISSSNQWYYDTSEEEGLEEDFNQGLSKNLYVTDTSADKGIEYTELKAAIRVRSVIEAIETNYQSITFSDDFFASADFSNLYLFLSKNKGDVKNLNEVNESLIDGFTNQFDPLTLSGITDGFTLTLSGVDFRYISLVFDVETLSTEDYTIVITNDGNEVYRESLNGNSEIFFPQSEIIVGSGYNVYVAAETAITLTKLEWRVTYEPFDTNEPTFYTTAYSTPSGSFTNTFTFNVPRQMPKIKILDFLKGLFNMFNLTAYVEDGVIVVKTLNQYYLDGTALDLSSELDLGEVNVKRVELFSDIDFKFSDPKTFGIINQNEVAQDDFGNLRFQSIENGKNGNLVFDGSKYEIKLPFEKILFERISNEGSPDLALTPFLQGWLVDKDQNETITKPFLFYNIPTTIDDSNYNFGFKGKNEYITQYNRPSNSNALGTKTINFGKEVDEYTGLSTDNSLYKLHYEDYISNLFKRDSRIVRYTTILKLNTLLNYKMNDKIIVNGNPYRINTIKTNLTSGKTDLELISDFQGYEIVLSSVGFLEYISRIGGDVVFRFSPSIQASGYNVFLNNIFSEKILPPYTFVQEPIGAKIEYTLSGVPENQVSTIIVQVFDTQGNVSDLSAEITIPTV